MHNMVSQQNKNCTFKNGTGTIPPITEKTLAKETGKGNDVHTKPCKKRVKGQGKEKRGGH